MKVQTLSKGGGGQPFPNWFSFAGNEEKGGGEKKGEGGGIIVSLGGSETHCIIFGANIFLT